MRKAVVFWTISTMLAGAAFGADKRVATLTTNSSFQLRGADVPAAGVPHWPVMAGDTMVAGSGTATLTLDDGSRITLDPNSSARVDKRDGRINFHLLTGSSSYELASNSNVTVFSGEQPVTAAAKNDPSGIPPGRINAAEVKARLIARGVPGKGLPNALENITKPRPVSKSK